MAIKSKTRYAILGVLSIKPSTGYDIKKFCDKTISHFWNENFGHIYPVLNQLQEEGLIKQDSDETQERRKIYSITDDGKKEFCHWLMQPVEVQPQRSELLLKLSFSSHIPKKNVIDMIETIKERHNSNLKQYKEIEEVYQNYDKVRYHQQYAYWLPPLRYGILASEAAIKWCDETILFINNQEEEGE